ncbi:uncharacterized protein LOC143183834 [Calliopsis andreniformis]|uniref:uncharacterized protein LOC143183834 n=1 Tax=Calliopsis andreniformis TaxID=337506 RepID=UPI003FCC3392
MNTKHSPKKVTLAMMKGKPIATSVPVIHYHANDDELEEIYPSTDEEKRLTPEFEKISSKAVSSTPLKCTERKSTHEVDITENSSENRSNSAENILPEGGTPPLDPWKMFSEIRGKITKTFEEKLSEIKSDKRKRSYSRAESSSISESEDQGNITPCDEKTSDKQIIEQTPATVVHKKSNPVRYVAFSGVKTGLKDKNIQDESVESGVEASEFSQDINDEVVSQSKTDSPKVESSHSTTHTITDNPKHQQSSHMHSTTIKKKTNFDAIFSHLVQQLMYQAMFRSIAVFVAIFCIYYVISIPEYLFGFSIGVFATITVYDIVAKIKEILTTLPDEKFVPKPVIPVLEIPAVEEHAVIERFQGWLNELPYRYEPSNYRVARTKSVYFRLEGSILRIMETRMKIPKKAVWDEPKHKLKFTKRRVYDLTGAKIELLPHGLARRRRWSKKYPICITLKKEALICNVTLKSSINDECSIGDYHYKPVSKKRVKYGSNKKHVTKWEEMSNDHGTWFIEAEDEESSITERNEEQEEDDDDEVAEDDDDFFNYDDDDDDGESCNQDSNNEEFNGECLEYVESFSENAGVKNDEKEEIKYKKGKEEDKVTDMIRKMMKKDRSEYHYKKDKEEKKRREASNGTKFRKRRLNIGKENKIKNDSEQGKKEDKRKKLMEKEEEEEKEEVDDDDDDEDDDEEDEDEYNYDNKQEEDEEAKVKEEETFATMEENEEEDEGEMQQRDDEKEEWETIDGLTQFKHLRSPFKKSSKNGEQNNELKLFMFARADREKEDWFRRLTSAVSRRAKTQDSQSFSSEASSSTNATSSIAQRTIITESKSCNSSINSIESVPELNYNAYMTKYLDVGSSSTSESKSTLHADNTLWINCLIARILFDVHRCPETINLIQDKIQRKLSSIKLPYFMECLLVSEVAIGQGAPIIRSVTKPVTNERGLWLDLDITYKGCLTMTVETKLNLMKLTKTGGSGGSISSNTGNSVMVPTEKHESVARSPIFDSDMEDTPETSTEDDDQTTSRTQIYNAAKETSSTQSSRRKLLSMVDRIAANKYFQHATELSYVRRAMEGVSNTEIRLMVTVSSIEGCLSVNIPPAPSDRLWYGFKPVPKVTLTVKSVVGERTVNIVYITKWIEAKLLREFEKLVVLPNMDDFVLPLCPNYPYTTTQ